LLSGERCLAAPRARRAASTPARRPAAFPDGRDRAVTLDAREKPPLLVVPSVLRARAPARSRSPSRSAPVAVGWTSPVRRPRFARARTPLTPRPPGNRPRVPSASPSPRPRSASPPSAWCVPSRAAAAPRAAFADISAVSRLRAHTRKMPLRCRERWTHGAKLVAKLGAMRKLIAPTRATPRIAPLLRRPFFPSRARLTPDV